MMEFIRNYFIDVTPIAGGLQFNASYAALVFVLWFAIWRAKRMFRKHA